MPHLPKGEGAFCIWSGTVSVLDRLQGSHGVIAVTALQLAFSRFDVRGLGAVAEHKLEDLNPVVLLGYGGIERAVLIVGLAGAVQHLGAAVLVDALDDQDMAERLAGTGPGPCIETRPAGIGCRDRVSLHGGDAPGERGFGQTGMLGLDLVTEAGGQGGLGEESSQQNHEREEAVHDGIPFKEQGGGVEKSDYRLSLYHISVYMSKIIVVRPPVESVI